MVIINVEMYNKASIPGLLLVNRERNTKYIGLIFILILPILYKKNDHIPLHKR